MNLTITPNRIGVPVTGAWDFATYLADPRMSVAIRIHNGAGPRA
jgi:hypothetical protein